LVSPHHFLGLDYELSLLLFAVLSRLVSQCELCVSLPPEDALGRIILKAAVFALELSAEWTILEDVAQLEFDCRSFVDSGLQDKNVIHFRHARFKVQFILLAAA